MQNIALDSTTLAKNYGIPARNNGEERGVGLTQSLILQWGHFLLDCVCCIASPGENFIMFQQAVQPTEMISNVNMPTFS